MPYNTRSTTRRKHEEAGDATVSPSATGRGTHIRWNYANQSTPSSSATPELSYYGSSGSDSSFTSLPSTPPNTHTRNHPSTEQGDTLSPFADEDEEIARRGMMALQAHKTATEEILREWDSSGEYSEELIEELHIEGDHGRSLPKGIKGLGPYGTFLISDEWHPRPSENDPATTDQLPTINEDANMDIDQDDNSSSTSHPKFVQGSSRDRAPVEGGSFSITRGGLPEFVSRSEGW